MKETGKPTSGLANDPSPLRKALVDEEERKRLEELKKALTDRPQAPASGLVGAEK